MDNQLKYVLGGIGIGIPLLLTGSYAPALAKDHTIWMMLIGLIAAAIITLIAELYIISQKLYGDMKDHTAKLPAKISVNQLNKSK
jgi:predicted lysophospholipase L1 biosynthesis ABC-type transport system permease subunit